MSTEKKDFRSFDESYASKAHLQTSFNDLIIAKLVEKVQSWFPESISTTSLKILDLCCGHGKPTYDLLTQLLASGIQVEKIVGLDISEAQISKAKSDYGDIDKLEFAVQDIETISYDHEFDIVISLFGLHWTKNLPETALLIYESLKPSGQLMFFVPLEKMDLFESRQNFLLSTEWREVFTSFAIQPFIKDPEGYTSVFDPYFEHKSDALEVSSGTRTLHYTKQEFIAFLSSWIPELRYLSTIVGASPETYAPELVDSIMARESENIHVPDAEHVDFTEHFLSYEGTAKCLGTTEE